MTTSIFSFSRISPTGFRGGNAAKDRQTVNREDCQSCIRPSSRGTGFAYRPRFLRGIPRFETGALPRAKSSLLPFEPLTGQSSSGYNVSSKRANGRKTVLDSCSSVI